MQVIVVKDVKEMLDIIESDEVCLCLPTIFDIEKGYNKTFQVTSIMDCPRCKKFGKVQ